MVFNMEKVKKYKAEAFDAMQYFYNVVNASHIHCVIHFDRHVDEEVLKEAVTVSANALPLIKCGFIVSPWRPYWREQDFTGEDMVHMVEAGSKVEEQRSKLLASDIDIAHGPQLKIYILREKNSDTLCIIMNHMICDGAGFKEYLYLVSDLYAILKNKNSSIPELRFVSRSTRQLFKNFNFFDKLAILFSRYDLSKQKQQEPYCLQGDMTNPIFSTLHISKEEFLHLKYYAKSHRVTVNDLIVTAYARVFNRETGNKRIVVPCPVDLRKYLNPKAEHGIANFTSNYICDVTFGQKDSFEETLAQVSGQLARQKLSRNCLKPVLMMEAAYHLAPFRILEKAFGSIFTIPIVSFTNLGVIDNKRLNFGDVEIVDAYVTGTVKNIPYFQVGVSTFDDVCTLSCNLYGTDEDRTAIEHFLEEIRKELV